VKQKVRERGCQGMCIACCSKHDGVCLLMMCAYPLQPQAPALRHACSRMQVPSILVQLLCRNV
jgi:hypothetical protein